MSSVADLKKAARPIYDEIKGQTDRGAAIIAASILEEELTEALNFRLLLTSRLRDRLFSHEKNGPLSHFSGKIDIAQATGLIPSEWASDLHLFRRIRNRFAHKIDALKFDDPEVSSWISSLHVGGYLTEPRRRFIICSMAMSAGLYALRIEPDIKLSPIADHHISEHMLRQVIAAITKLRIGV